MPLLAWWTRLSFKVFATNTLEVKLFGNKFRTSRRERFAENTPLNKRYVSIHDLPSEILVYIFDLGCYGDTWLPVRISHVCGFWRTIALHSPCLWRHIVLSPHIHMWKRRILRARSYSLDISLRSSAFSGFSCLNFDNVQLYMRLVTPHIHRWRSLEIVLLKDAPFIMNGALAGCCGWNSEVEAPLVEEITIIYRAIDRWKEYTCFTLFGGVAPQLNRVTLEGVRLTWLPSLFGNLTYLDYTLDRFTRADQAVDWLLLMLEVSTQLTQLRVCFPCRTPSTRAPVDTSVRNGDITLARLAHLQLRVDSRDIPTELARFLKSLHAPVLKHLHLANPSSPRVPFHTLRTFVRSCHLPKSVTTLRIGYRWYDPHIAWYRIFPMLQQLVVSP